ncbi:recombinase family protein [Mesorhizobium sp. M0808]|uniref:recombinase family protein n=1 Tax=Mesorhizobium sp. M0808 TaxID=2957002 RepID=UPI003337271F
MGEIVGYCRVSSRSQDYQTQVDRLTAAGATKIYKEKMSGLDDERPELAECMRYLRDGDTLIITKLDRLARSTLHLHRIVAELAGKRDKKNPESTGVGFKVLDDPSLDTTSRTGKLVFGILASIAEFETEIRRERQMDGIARAKAAGRTGGRPKRLTDDIEARVAALRADKMSIRQIAADIGFSKATVQKIMEKQAGEAVAKAA